MKEIENNEQSFLTTPPTTLHPADVTKDISAADLAGTKVLLINMPLRESGPAINAPQGPLLLDTNLRQKYGVDATIVDLNYYRIQDDEARQRGLPNGRHLNYREARELIACHIQKSGRPALVGLSGKVTTLRWQQMTARIIRELLSDETLLISGNGLATQAKLGLIQFIPELDGICSSDGDDVIIKMVADAKLIHTRGIKSAVASGKLRPYLVGPINGRQRFFYVGDRPRNLDQLPFADLELLSPPIRDHYLRIPLYGRREASSSIPWPDDAVTPKANAVSTRGCPHGCTYCFRGANGERDWTVRSAQHIYQELAYYKERYGIKMFGFHDDNFAVRADRIAELVPLLGPLAVKWGALARLDEISGLKPNGKFEVPLRVEDMAKAGCIFIGFGPESASPEVLKTIGKGGHTLSNGMVDVELDGQAVSFPRSMVEGIRNSLRVGIHSNCTWIFASPSETLADTKITVQFIQWQIREYERFGTPANAINQNMFTMTYYPGTTMVNNQKVRQELHKHFGLNFVPIPPNTVGTLWEPVIDENFQKYVLELDDATKVLHSSETGEPVNFSQMDTATFLKVRECIDNRNLAGILAL